MTFSFFVILFSFHADLTRVLFNKLVQWQPQVGVLRWYTSQNKGREKESRPTDAPRGFPAVGQPEPDSRMVSEVAPAARGGGGRGFQAPPGVEPDTGS